jgi:hypothetical protein
MRIHALEVAQRIEVKGVRLGGIDTAGPQPREMRGRRGRLQGAEGLLLGGQESRGPLIRCRCSLKAGLPPMEYQGVKRPDFP